MQLLYALSFAAPAIGVGIGLAVDWVRPPHWRNLCPETAMRHLAVERCTCKCRDCAAHRALEV